MALAGAGTPPTLLARQTGGFLFAATQQTGLQNLADLGAAYAT
jgi:hypothetical protein